MKKSNQSSSSASPALQQDTRKRQTQINIAMTSTGLGVLELTSAGINFTFCGYAKIDYTITFRKYCNRSTLLCSLCSSDINLSTRDGF